MPKNKVEIAAAWIVLLIYHIDRFYFFIGAGIYEEAVGWEDYSRRAPAMCGTWLLVAQRGHRVSRYCYSPGNKPWKLRQSQEPTSFTTTCPDFLLPHLLSDYWCLGHADMQISIFSHSSCSPPKNSNFFFSTRSQKNLERGRYHSKPAQMIEGTTMTK